MLRKYEIKYFNLKVIHFTQKLSGNLLIDLYVYLCLQRRILYVAHCFLQAVLSEEPLPAASDLLTAGAGTCCGVASPAASAASGSNVQTLSSRARPLAMTANITGGARGRGITAPPSLIFLAPNAPSLRTGLPGAATAAAGATLSTASGYVGVSAESESQLQVPGGSNADTTSHSHALLTAAISSATAASVHSDSGTFFARRHYVTSRLYMRLNSLFADNQVRFGHEKRYC